MGGEWTAARLEEVAAGIQTGPFGSQLHASDYVPAGVPVVMPTNIHDRRIDTEGISFIGDEDADRLSRHKLQLNDLVFSRRGEVDKCALVTRDTVGWLCGTGCLLVRPDAAKCDPAFLSFHISAPDTREWLKQHAVGLVMPNLNTKILSSIPLKLPPLGEQRRIAHLLGSLDDKIELNRRMAATLEEMARALFKSWFVDFDPVRAKAEGRDPGLPATTAALFPDAFGEDGLPVGWSATANDIGCSIREQVRPSDVEASAAYVGLEHIEKRSLALNVIGRAEDVDSQKAVFGRGDLLFGKLRPYFHKVAIAPVDGICSTDIFVFRPQRGIPPSYLYFAFSADAFVAKASGAQEGTRMPRADWGFMRKLVVAKPQSQILSAFDNAVAPLIDQILATVAQTQTLASLRDTLLPKLISGELRIKDAGNEVEAA